MMIGLYDNFDSELYIHELGLTHDEVSEWETLFDNATSWGQVVDLHGAFRHYVPDDVDEYLSAVKKLRDFETSHKLTGKFPPSYAEACSLCCE